MENIRIKTIIKCLVSLSLIIILIYNIDIDQIMNSIYKANYYLLGLIFILLLIQFPITAIKWKVSLMIHNLNYKFSYLLITCFVAFFYNNFLPSNIGGDGYKILKTIPQEGKKTYAISAILYERIIGLLALLFLGYIGSFVIMLKTDNSIAKMYLIAGTLGTILFLIFIILTRSTYLIKSKIFSFLIENIALIKNSGNKNIYLCGYSLLFQIIAILSFYIMFIAFDSRVSLEQCALIVTISSLAALIPFSINGIGIFEGAIVFVCMEMSIDKEVALAASLALRVLLIPLSLIGGLFCFIENDKIDSKT